MSEEGKINSPGEDDDEEELSPILFGNDNTRSVEKKKKNSAKSVHFMAPWEGQGKAQDQDDNEREKKIVDDVPLLSMLKF